MALSSQRFFRFLSREYLARVVLISRPRYLSDDPTGVLPGEGEGEEEEEEEEVEEGGVASVQGQGSLEREGAFKRRKPVCLPTVSMPEELQTSIDTVISTCSSRKSCIQDGKELASYLQRRIPSESDWKDKESPSLNNNETTDSGRRSGKVERGNLKYNPSSVWTKKKEGRIEGSDALHGGTSKMAPKLKYQKRESLAFLAGRTPASYGTALRVLSEISASNKSYSPQTLLDFGSGVGTVEWAAHQLWRDSIYEYQCVDISNDMLEMAKRVRLGGHNLEDMLEVEKSSQKEHIRGVYSRQYLPLSKNVKYDIVVSGHTLGELPSAKLRSFTTATLWRKTNDYLVLIEPGTWYGFKIITEARNMILDSSNWIRFENETEEELHGHVFSPCPHDYPCPLLENQENVPKKPCHFAQRVQLSSSEKNSPLKKKGYHIENFCYVVFKKGKRDAPAEESENLVRLLEPVKKRSRHIICKMCTSEGNMEEKIFTKKKHGGLYKEGRKCQWGDTLKTGYHESCSREEGSGWGDTQLD